MPTHKAKALSPRRFKTLSAQLFLQVFTEKYTTLLPLKTVVCYIIHSWNISFRKICVQKYWVLKILKSFSNFPLLWHHSLHKSTYTLSLLFLKKKNLLEHISDKQKHISNGIISINIINICNTELNKLNINEWSWRLW